MRRGCAAVLAVSLAIGACQKSTPTPTPTTSFQEFRDPAGRFRCEFPSAPKETQVPTGKYTALAYTSELHPDGAVLLVSVTDFGTTGIEDIEKGFDGSRDQLLRNQRGTLLGETRISLGGVPGRSLTIRLGSGRTMHARLYFKGAVLYLVQAIRREPEPSEGMTKFLSSFQLL